MNSTQTEINNLKNDNKKLKEEIESLTKKANSSSKKDDELWETIEEKKKMYSTNETLIDQKKINVNQLKNKNLMSMYEDIDKQITQLYKEDWQQNEQIQNDIESKKALSQVYLDLSKMNPDNGVENNLKYLFNQYTSNPNANDSSKKKNYIDNLTINCYAMLNSIYDSQNASESSEKKLNLEQKLGNYWLNQHPEDFETKEIEKEVDNRGDFEKVISTVGATICQTGMTVWHGVENAAESVVDFAVTAGTGITSLGTSIIDLTKGEFGNPNSLTVNLYKDLDSFVATDWVGNAADSIYNTDYGKWVENNSLYKRDDIVGNIVRGAGEVGGKLAFAAVTAGAASTIGSSATATGAISSNTFNITNALSTTTVMNPIIAGITGYGQGMESALQDGASHTGASVYATANAAWEAVQWKIGGNINNWTSKSLAESTSIAKNLGILAGSVAMDSVDSAVEGVVQPGMQMLYNGKTFEQSFNDNGGWETVGAQAALGGIMSTLGSAKDFTLSNKNILSTTRNNYGDTTPLQNVTAKIKSGITTAGLKDSANSKIYNFDGNKIGLSEQLKSKFKAVTGFGSAMVGTIGVISGNPIFSTAGLPLAYKGIKNALDGVVGNYVVGSNFSVYRHRVTDAIDANFKPGRSYAEGKLTADKIVTDRIGQDVLDGKIFLTGRLDTNQDRVFGLPLINLLQQLKSVDVNGNKIIYSCQSQSQTLMLLRNLAKEGYIDNLKYSKSILSSQNLEKHLMGADVTGKKHQLYEMNFEVSKDKIFDIAAAADKAKMLGFDPNLYDAKIKKINGKEVILYEANLPKMLEASTGAKIIKSGLNSTELSESLKTISDDSALKILANGNGKYGVDQGLLTDLRTKNPTTYLEIKNKLVNEYKFNNVDAERFLSIVDSIGACNYACEANVFISYFKNSPEEFENIFGFPLYKQNQNGELYLNDAELLVDLYYWGNAKSDEAELFKIDSNGKTIFNDEAIKYKQDGSIKSVHQRGGGINQELMNDYLKSKGSSITFDVDNLYTGKIDSKTLSIDKIKNDLVDRINSGEQVSMVTSANKNAIIYTDIDTGKKYPITGGHWTKIMDYTDNGVIVSSWGKRCLVKFEDLPKIDAFDFFSVKINDKIN